MAAKKPAKSNKTKTAARTSGVRNSPIPKKPATKSRSAANAASVASPIGKTPAVTHEMIAKRAYEIAQSGNGSGELDNWLRAERELRGV